MFPSSDDAIAKGPESSSCGSSDTSALPLAASPQEHAELDLDEALFDLPDLILDMRYGPLSCID